MKRVEQKMLENRYEIIWFWANENRKLSMLEIGFLMGSYDIYDTYKLWIKITIIIVSKETEKRIRIVNYSPWSLQRWIFKYNICHLSIFIIMYMH